MKFAVAALLMSSTEAFKLDQRFADGITFDEILNDQTQYVHSYAQEQGICDGPNGSNMQDCRTTRWGDQNPVCRGRPGEEPERNCVLRNGGYGYNYSQIPSDPYQPLEPNPPCTGRPGEEPERNCLQRAPVYKYAYTPIYHQGHGQGTRAQVSS